MIEKLLTKREDLILKHKELNELLEIQKEPSVVKETKKSIRKVEKTYEELRESIYDYFYSLPEEEADLETFPNPDYIGDLYTPSKTINKNNNDTIKSKNVTISTSDKKLLSDISKEIDTLFRRP